MNAGRATADLERCGEPHADELAQIYVQAVRLIEGRPEEDAIIDEIEPQVESLEWGREVNPSTERSRLVRTTETGVSLDMFIGVGQGPDTAAQLRPPPRLVLASSRSERELPVELPVHPGRSQMRRDRAGSRKKQITPELQSAHTTEAAMTLRPGSGFR